MNKYFRRISFLFVLALAIGTFVMTVGAQDVAREDTVIFDIDSSAVPNPTNFNYLVPAVF